MRKLLINISPLENYVETRVGTFVESFAVIYYRKYHTQYHKMVKLRHLKNSPHFDFGRKKIKKIQGKREFNGFTDLTVSYGF